MTDLRQIVERGLGPGTFSAREFNPWQDYVENKSGLLVPSHTIVPESNHLRRAFTYLPV